MVRIIYHWYVEPEQFEQFKNAWHLATNNIHKNVAGAKGSFMMQKQGSPTEVLTVARWDSLDQWENFWEGERPEEMQQMHELGERITVEVYEEIDNQTKY